MEFLPNLWTQENAGANSFQLDQLEENFLKYFPSSQTSGTAEVRNSNPNFSFDTAKILS